MTTSHKKSELVSNVGIWVVFHLQANTCQFHSEQNILGPYRRAVVSGGAGGAKGQLISKCLFDFLNFSKKQRKNLMNF